MRRFWMLIGTLMLGVGLAQTPPVADLSQDARLQKPITVWLRIETLPDALKAIQKQVGVPLVCPDRFRNEKVAIFVENRPAHEVLTMLAKLFRMRWEVYEDGYRIERPSEETELEEEATRLAQEAKRKGVEAYIETARRVLAMTPEQRKQRIGAIQKELEKQQGRASEAALRSEFGHLSALESSVEETSLLFALLGIVPQAHISRLLKGEVLTYSTHPSAGVNAIPPAVGQWYETQRKAQLEKPSTEEQEWYREYLRNRKILRFSVGYRLSSVSNEILCQLGVEKEQTIQPALPRCEHRLFQTTVSLDEIVSDRSRLTREWNQWSESSESLRAWLQRLKPLPNRTPRPPDWQPFQEQRYMRNFVMPTQRLELLAWQYGLPIVADAYRLGLEVLIDTSTPLAAIQSLQNTHWMRREGDYLLVRRKRYWEWRAVEPPEAPIRELEAKFQKEGTLTIDDYARFVAALDEKPYQWLLENRVFRGFSMLAVHFPVEPLSNLPLLRFWATLTPAQRQAVLAGEFLPLRTLTLPQRKAFEHALEPLFPHPNRLLDPPSECRFTTFRWIFPVWDLEDTKAAVPAESGFGLLGAPKKLRRTALFTDSSRGTPMLIFSEDRGSDELDTAQFLEEGETLLRKENAIATVYGFRFFMAPGMEQTYEFGYFVPLKETPQNGSK